jgi:hypothetical protein
VTPRTRKTLVILSALIPVLVLAPALRSDASGAARWSKASRWAKVVTDPRIDEASGISRSTYRRDVVFLHNDSGDIARFFAVGHRGQTRAVFTVPNVQAHDWEDMASGPRHTLWFGDIGDNRERRTSIDVVRVKEPRHLRSHAVKGKVFNLRYPDGPHNAEALLVRPHSGRVYVVTKDRSGGTIYRAPKHLSAHHMNRLHAVASAPDTVTGGDFAPKGHRFVLRNYSTAYFYRKIGGRPDVVTLPREHQGEAIGFTRSGDSVKLASEGRDQPIWRVER